MRLSILLATALLVAACSRGADGPVLYEVRHTGAGAAVVVDPGL